MTKLKPQDRRVPFNRLVHPRTIRIIKRFAKRYGSEGKAMDAAAQSLNDGVNVKTATARTGGG